MPTYSAPIPRCICTALCYDEDCPLHGRMYGVWRQRRENPPVASSTPTPAPTPPTYPLVKLWLWLERATGGRLR